MAEEEELLTKVNVAEAPGASAVPEPFVHLMELPLNDCSSQVNWRHWMGLKAGCSRLLSNHTKSC